MPDVASDPDLVARITAEIEAEGPMTFARFMELALYDPDHGYYSTAQARPTRDGDFLTAPELHPIFGRAIARHVAAVWQRLGAPRDFTVREYGAGSGALGEAILEGIAHDEPALAATVRYAPAEHNSHRMAELRKRLAVAGFGDRLAPAEGPLVGVVLANEFLDALPVHRVRGAADGGLRELIVTVADGRFTESETAPSTPLLAARLAADGVRLAPGQVADVRLADEAWLAEVARDLRGGVATIVDYALPAAELYRPARADGTLVAYLGHVAHDDLFRAVGRQDLTAHVDLTALERAAAAGGLELLGEASQAAFLVANGLADLVEEVRSNRATSLAQWSELRASVARLLDPRALGGFRVVVLGRGVASDPPLPGLAAPHTGAGA
ncbi:MAG TPA: SAM-dependent methyltransferase [Candidatus Limnocylindrales bacterium]|nr:SAM-dependent methyltransferase [Candidatus Limnocylindrales bacterium]